MDPNPNPNPNPTPYPNPNPKAKLYPNPNTHWRAMRALIAVGQRNILQNFAVLLLLASTVAEKSEPDLEWRHRHKHGPAYLNLYSFKRTSNITLDQARGAAKMFLGSGLEMAASADNLCTNALDCWLQNLVFTLPDLSFDEHGVSGSVTDLTCYGIDLEGITSAYNSPATLSLAITGLGTICEGNWAYELDTWPHPGGSGTLGIDLSDTDIGLTMYVGIEGHMPSYLNITSCGVKSIDIQLSFSGGITGAILNLFSEKIDQAIEDALNSLACVTLADKLEQNITYHMQHVTQPKLESILAVQPDTPGTFTGMINWHEEGLVNKVSKILNAAFDPASNIGCMDGINTFLEYITDDKGILSVDLDQTIIIPVTDPTAGPLGNISLTFNQLNISGLTSFSQFVLVEPSKASNQSLSTVIALDNLDVALQMSVDIELSQQKLAGVELIENFVIKLGTKDVKLESLLVLAIVDGTLDLYVDQLFQKGCFASAVQEVSFASLSLNMTIDNIEVVQEASSLEHDLDEFINNFMMLFTNDFRWLVTSVIDGIVQGPVRARFNEALNSSLVSAKQSPCPPHMPHSSSYYVEWTSSKALAVLDAIVNGKLGAQGVNEFIECFAPDGTVTIPLDLGFGKFSDVEVFLSGLDSFYKLSLLVPDEQRVYDLDTTIGLGHCDASTCKPFAIGLKLYSSDASRLASSSSTMIEITFQNLEVYLALVLKLDAAQVADLAVAQLGTSACMASTFDTIAIREVEYSADSAKMYFNADMIRDIGMSNHTLLNLLQRLNLTNAINGAIANKMSTAGQECVGELPTDDASQTLTDSNTWAVPLVMVIVGSVCVLLLFLCFYYRSWKSKRQYRKLGLSLRWHHLIDWNETLLFAANVPWWARYSIPVALVGTFAMFISANLGIGASVELQILLGGTTFKPDPVFEFGLANTVRDMWNAKTYELAVLIALFSGGWPYLKLVLMLVAWCTPARILSVRVRERLLVYLDALGKWSLVDSFVLVLMMVAFRFHLVLAQNDKQILVEVFVVPKWGFYGFLLATMISLGMTHLIVAIHRASEETRQIPSNGDQRREALMSHWYKLSTCTEACFTTLGACVVALLLVAAGMMVVVGAIIYSFVFEFKGLTGFLLGDDARQPYSLVSLGFELPAASGTPQDFGVRWIQATYMAFGVAIPIALAVGLLMLWLAPLSLNIQRRVYVLCEILNAWSGLEVLVVSIIAAVLQIHQFAMFIVGDSCDKINVLIAKTLDEQLNGDDVCFDVVATLDKGCWILFTASLVFVCVMWPIQRLCHEALDERLDEAAGVPVGPGKGPDHVLASASAPLIEETAEEKFPNSSWEQNPDPHGLSVHEADDPVPPKRPSLLIRALVCAGLVMLREERRTHTTADDEIIY